MDVAVKTRLEQLNANYTKVTGREPRGFFCPILHRDTERPVCRAHIVNEAFPDSDRSWTIQRTDVDNWFGSMFEADFVQYRYKGKLRAVDALANPDLRRQLQPKLDFDGEDVGYYASDEPVPARFSPVLVDHQPEPIKLVLKRSPEELRNAPDARFQISFEQDLRLPALVALLKAAHLTLFHQARYDYALTAGGRFLGRTILGDFFDRTVGRSKAEVILEAQEHFRAFRSLVRPVLANGTGLAGTLTDGLLYLCEHLGGFWAKKVLIRTGEHLSAVLVPVFEGDEQAARFVRFLDQGSGPIEARLARFTGAHWEVSPNSQRFEWPVGNFA